MRCWACARHCRPTIDERVGAIALRLRSVAQACAQALHIRAHEFACVRMCAHGRMYHACALARVRQVVVAFLWSLYSPV